MTLKEKFKNISIILYLGMRMLGSALHLIRLLFINEKTQAQRR